MTPFQKNVLLLQHKREKEQAQQQQQGGAEPQGALNARNPNNRGYREEHHYTNAREYETENQVEFVE